MKKSVFIIGAPRSGTTLLASLLRETEYGAPIETHFIVKYYKRISRYGDLRVKENVDRLLDHILQERAIMQRKLDIDKDKFYSSLTEYTFSEITDKILSMIFEKKGKHAWGDKTPGYIFDLDIIYKMFPHSKYIYIIRDGRDVSLSLLQQPWGPNNLITCGLFWSKANSHPYLKTMQDEGVMLKVKYEDLLSNPNSTLRRVYEFLAVKLSDDQLQELIQSINSNNFNKWKKKMSKRQIQMFEAVARTVLRKNGYETITSPGKGYNINKFELWLWQLHNAFFMALHLVKINTIEPLFFSNM